MSFAFTFTESTSLFTRETSPLRQASNSSLKAPPMLLLASVGLAAPEPGLEPLLLLQPPPPPPEAAVLKLVLVARVGAGRSGEAGLISVPTLHSLSLSGGPTAEVSRAMGGEAGGAADTELFRGGDCELFCCCCCCDERRDAAITAAPATRRRLRPPGKEPPFPVS